MHLNLIQVAQSLGVEESVVMAWVRHDALPCVKDSGRLLFDRSQVAGWATERGLAARAGFLSSAAQDNPENCSAIEAMLRRGGIWREVHPADVPLTLAGVIERLGGLTPQIRQMLVHRVQSPGALTWAPVGKHFALPHLRSRVALGRDHGLISLMMLSAPMPLEEATPDGLPVRYLLFFMAPTPRSHLEVLAGLSASITRGPFGQSIKNGAPDAEVFRALSQSCPAEELKTTTEHLPQK